LHATNGVSIPRVYMACNTTVPTWNLSPASLNDDGLYMGKHLGDGVVEAAIRSRDAAHGNGPRNATLPRS
jgi:hypothetical protein